MNVENKFKFWPFRFLCVERHTIYKSGYARTYLGIRVWRLSLSVGWSSYYNAKYDQKS